MNDSWQQPISDEWSAYRFRAELQNPCDLEINKTRDRLTRHLLWMMKRLGIARHHSSVRCEVESTHDHTYVTVSQLGARYE